MVLEAVLRIGRRALPRRRRSRSRLAAFVAIFFFDVPFPSIVLGAAAVGLIGARVAPRRSAGRGRRPPRRERGARGHRRAARRRRARARAPSWRRALRVAAVWLSLWLAPVAGSGSPRGRGDVFTEIAIFFSQIAVVTFGGAYAVLAYVAQQAVEALRLAHAARDARRPRHGRDDAGPADPGGAVRRLPRRLAQPGRAAALARRHARGRAHDLGDLRALLPLDLPRRALRRAPAREPRGCAARSPGSRRRSSA